MTSFVYVKLGREQTQHARREAAHRSTTARLYGARNGTNAETGLSSALADEIGALCELAVANYVGLPTNFGHDYDPDGADVGPIEVRGRKMGSAYHDVRIYETDIHKADYIVGASIMENGPEALIRLNGWNYTQEAFDNSTVAPFAPHPVKGQARHHSVTALRPMATLIDELTNRRQ